jgi:NTP pyrophosphatase (non-canonical NTP hydrolase)
MAQRKQVQRIRTSPDGHGHDHDQIALGRLRDRLRDFVTARDWGQFHSPKNLAIALSVEAGELLEHFQWVPDQDSLKLSPDIRRKIEEEMADVLLYLIRLADLLDVELIQSADNKIAANAKKYPVEKARGTAKKYTEL